MKPLKCKRAGVGPSASHCKLCSTGLGRETYPPFREGGTKELKELGQLKDDDEANKDGEDPEGKKKAADPKAKADSSKKKKTKENGEPPKKKQKLSSLEECSFNTCP